MRSIKSRFTYLYLFTFSVLTVTLPSHLQPVGLICLSVSLSVGVSVNPCLRSVSMPGHLVSGTRSMWIELRRQAEDSSIHPVGLEFRANVTALCPCEWTVDLVWFRNLTFDDMQDLKASYNSDPTVKEELLRYDSHVKIRGCLLYTSPSPRD